MDDIGIHSQKVLNTIDKNAVEEIKANFDYHNEGRSEDHQNLMYNDQSIFTQSEANSHNQIGLDLEKETEELLAKMTKQD